MIEGRPTVFISYSEAAKAQVAVPFKEFVDSLGLYGLLVGDEALPEPGAADPRAKVNHFLDQAQMFVALATPDDRTEAGEVQTRPNIILELGAALDRDHLANRVQVFKAAAVVLPSNINPVHERLDPDRVEETFALFERQARTWGLLPQRPPPAPAAQPAAPDQQAAPPAGGEGSGAAAAAAALVGLARLIEGEPEERGGEIAARAHLAATAALAQRRSSEPLGVHELNGLYRDRATVEPDQGERRELLRSVIANLGAANAPGWYWLRSFEAGEVRTLVALLAAGEGDDQVPREAIRLLREAPGPPPAGELRAIVRKALAGDGTNAAAALELLGRHGVRTDLRALAGELDVHAESEQDAVAAARLEIVAREAPAMALRRVLGAPDLLTAPVEESLLNGARMLPETKLREALGSEDEGLRALALRALNASSRLRKADLEAVIAEDPEGSVKFLAAELALRRRWRLSPEQFEMAMADPPIRGDRHRLGVSFAARRPLAELQAGLGWYGGQGYWAYEALGREHFELLEPRIESDLDSGFAELREGDLRDYAETVRRNVEAKLPAPVSEELRESVRVETERAVAAALERHTSNWEGLEDFIGRRFRAAALAVLAANPAPRFARFGRLYLDDPDREVASLAIRILRGSGGPEDVTALQARCGSAWGSIGAEAAEAALALSTDRRATALALLEVAERGVVEAALSGLGEGEPDRDEFAAIWPLLGSDELAIREAATRHLIGRCERGLLVRVLGAYSMDQYFYSVMARIDRELYAPGWVRQSARRILGG
jgi:hypothetical protein